MELATLHRMFPGRFVPGIGHGVQEWVAQAGVRAASPMTLLREYDAALRALLAGEEVSCAGRYVSLDRARLHWPPERAPLYIGGTGPKTLQFAGRHADGVMLSGVTRETLATSLEHIEAGVAARPSGAGRPELVVGIGAALGTDGHARLASDVAVYGLYTAAGSAAEIAEVVGELSERGIGTINLVPARDEPDLAEFVTLIGEEVRPLLS